MEVARKPEWTYEEYSLRRSRVCIVRDGERVVALVKGRYNADLICRARSDTKRNGSSSQRQRIKLQVLHEENRLLHTGLRRVAEALRGRSVSEITAARAEVDKILKRVKVPGQGL
jgi:hypothetical protein